MRYTQRLLTLLFAAVLLVGASAVAASAQRISGGSVYKRPVVRYYYVRDPFWSWNNSWYGWNDPYYYDPYLRERRTRYYKEKDVRDKRKDLAEDREEYYEDGYLTDKEQRKLAKAERKYNEAVDDLRDYNNDD